MSKTAIDLLKEDHKNLKRLLRDLVNTSTEAPSQREHLLQQIKTELEIHTTLEEKIFYPAFHAKGGKEEAEMFYEATEEHRAVELLVLPDLFKTNANSNQFSGRAKVLKELIEHHADEEEDEMFKAAKKLIKNEELVELGEKMEALKAQLKGRKSAA